MIRRVAPWILSVPLMLGGAELAHWLSYRMVYPNAFQRAAVLSQTGHGYFRWDSVIAALAGALVIMAVVWHWQALRSGRRSLRAAPHWQFLLLPALCFALQEHLEQLFTTGSVSGVSMAPTFLLGVLLTLPFGLLAYLVARLLLGVVAAAVRLLARPRLAREMPLSFAGSPYLFVPACVAACRSLPVRGPPQLL